MSEAGYSREGRERYLRAGNRIEMLGKITYPISADEVVFFLALKHSEWVAAHSAHVGTKVAPSSADGVPGGRERARQSRVPTGPRLSEGSRGDPAVPSRLSLERGAPGSISSEPAGSASL